MVLLSRDSLVIRTKSLMEVSTIMELAFFLLEEIDKQVLRKTIPGSSECCLTLGHQDRHL